MPDLVIENAPVETVRALESISAKTGRSVSEIALDYLPRPVSKGGMTDHAALLRRKQDGVLANRLVSRDALRLTRTLRDRALEPLLPDSTPAIRADRDAP